MGRELTHVLLSLVTQKSVHGHEAMLKLNRQRFGMGDNRCPICDTPTTLYRARSQNTCGEWKCLIAYRKMQRDSRRKHDELLAWRHQHSLVRAIRLRHTIASLLGVHEPETYRAIITPVNERPIVPQRRKRRYRFMKRLIQLVEKTLQDAPRKPRSFEDNQPSPPIFEAACANCKGKCCLRGATGAHLDADAIHRFTRLHPEADSHSILKAYSLCLPPATYLGSCVFHSANGCNLPRTMRSATCLNTVCSGVVELRLRIELDGESRFFLAAANKNRVVRGNFEACDEVNLRG